ncbi:MAG: hypothetical protein WD939_02410 [Dehalococcoidia bacterium]
MLLLIALLVVVGTTVWLRNSASHSASATSGGPEMILNVKGGDCDDADRPTKCEVAQGSQFTLSVDAVTAPASGYVSIRAAIDFGAFQSGASEDGGAPGSCSDGIDNGDSDFADRFDADCVTVNLMYKPAPTATEVVWPDVEEDLASRSTPGPGIVFYNASTAIIAPIPVSHFEGNLVEAKFTCSPDFSSNTIRLVEDDEPGFGVLGTLFFVGELFMQVEPKLASLTINCVEGPAPTPCQPAGCPTSTPTPTPTQAPPTATPCPAPGCPEPEMVLNVKGGDCDDLDRPTTCDVPTGETFTLSVEAPAVPPEGYIGVQTFVSVGVYHPEFTEDPDAVDRPGTLQIEGPGPCDDGLNNGGFTHDSGADSRDSDCFVVPLPFKLSDSRVDEFIWPDCARAIASRLYDLGLGWVHHSCLTSVFPAFPASTYTGTLVRVALTCTSEVSTEQVHLLPYNHSTAGPLGASFLPAPELGVEPVPLIPNVSDLTINCVEPLAVGGVSRAVDAGALGADGRPLRLWTLAVLGAFALAGTGWLARQRLTR